MIDQDIKTKLLDFGALNYSNERMAMILGVTDGEFSVLLSDGGDDAIKCGKARYEYELDKKLMQMALGGDLKAMEVLQKRKRSVRS